MFFQAVLIFLLEFSSIDQINLEEKFEIYWDTRTCLLNIMSYETSYEEYDV